MDRKEEKARLLCEIMTIKERMKFVKGDEEKFEELMKQLEEVREKLVEIETEIIIEEEGRKIK